MKVKLHSLLQMELGFFCFVFTVSVKKTLFLLICIIHLIEKVWLFGGATCCVRQHRVAKAFIFILCFCVHKKRRRGRGSLEAGWGQTECSPHKSNPFKLCLWLYIQQHNETWRNNRDCVLMRGTWRSFQV